jgi:uncharacterized protein YegJ (DUF2314 family)
MNGTITLFAIALMIGRVMLGLFVMQRLTALFAGKPNPDSKGTSDKEPLISLVLLLREHRFLDETILKRIAGKALDYDFTNASGEAQNFVTGHLPTFFLKFRGEIFLIHSFPIPYVDNADKAGAEIQELRTRKAVSEHKAWLSVDYMQLGQESVDLKAAYQTIGKLIAELADENCLAITSPATGRINVYDPELNEKLRGPNPLEDFAKPIFVPVTAVSSNDALMKAAVEESRRRWPEFVRAFENRSQGQMFSIKAPFSDTNHTEFMWVTVTGIENDVIYGTLDSDPVNVTSVKADERVKVRLSDLNDWIYMEEKTVIGGFTTKVLMRK